MEVELLVQDEAPQPGRKVARVDDVRVVESLQGQTSPDVQPAEVSEGARTAWRAGFTQSAQVFSLQQRRRSVE